MDDDSREVYTQKTTSGGGDGRRIVLVPQPSDDPRDPLCWSARKKYTTLFVLCFAAFAGPLGPTCFQLAYVLQAPIYGKTTVEMSYAVTAAVAGMFGGPIVFAPFASMFGRTSLIFWSLLLVIVCQIWGGLMTHSNDYIPFVISRWMAGMFASIPTILVPAYIMEIFFLHQRGRALTCLEISVLFSVVFSPTIGGFIVDAHNWTYTFWWTIPVIAFSATLVFFFLEEPHKLRGGAGPKYDVSYPTMSESFVRNRIDTLLPGYKVAPYRSAGKLAEVAIAPFKIGFAPITIIAGFYAFVAFGFVILMNIINTIVLQSPELEGGYGFTPMQNALFQFTQWVGCFASQMTGWLLGDRLPVWASKQGDGVWHPEYRLYNMLIPAFAGPIGLGLYGAAIQYHLHYMVLALGFFLVAWGASLSVPVCLNYIVECFIESANAAAIAMNCWRIGFSIALGFFVFPWEAAVGPGWTFGMCAFFDVFAALMIGVLIWKGKTLRRYTPKSLLATEEGEKITVSDLSDRSSDPEKMESERVDVKL